MSHLNSNLLWFQYLWSRLKYLARKLCVKTDLKLTAHNRNFSKSAVRTLKLVLKLNTNLNYICRVEASYGFYHSLCNVWYHESGGLDTYIVFILKRTVDIYCLRLTLTLSIHEPQCPLLLCRHGFWHPCPFSYYKYLFRVQLNSNISKRKTLVQSFIFILRSIWANFNSTKTEWHITDTIIFFSPPLLIAKNWSKNIPQTHSFFDKYKNYTYQYSIKIILSRIQKCPTFIQI